MAADNSEPLDYYLLPSIDMTLEKLLLAEDNGLRFDVYRFATLDFFFGMARRTRIGGGGMTDTGLIVQMIPIDQINVLNPRSRNKLTFQGIVSNIANLGLKRPITVTLRSEAVDGKRYNLVCGEGRLEAYAALGQTEIPAIVKDAPREDCFLMSLVENIARRRHSPSNSSGKSRALNPEVFRT